MRLRVEHSSIDGQRRYAAALADLNAAYVWGLDPERQRAYVTAALAVLPVAADDSAIRTCLTCYHHDHALVCTLRDPRDPQHDEAWRQWSAGALRIVQRHAANLAADVHVDVHDLAQLALEEIARALPDYRYACRFSTWAYAVVVRRVQRYARDSRAAKRAARPESLDEQHDAVAVVDGSVAVEAAAEAQALRDLVQQVLVARADARLATIFALWAVDDLRLNEIGRQVRLSAPRVSVLLEQARQLLRHDPAILDWIGHEGAPSAAGQEQ